MGTRRRLSELLRSSGRTRTALLLIYFAALSGWATWPMAADVLGTVPGPPGDNLYCVWLIGWFQRALLTLHASPFFVPLHDYPLGWPLAYAEMTLSNVLPALPLSLVGGPVFAYNAILFLSFILSGWFVFLWTDALLHDKPAALVAGTVFAIAPYRLAHLTGHLQVMGTQWLVLWFFGLTQLLKEGWSWKRALAAGLGLGLAALSSMYYLYMTLVVSALVVAGYLLSFGWREVMRSRFWVKLLGVGLTALPLVVAALVPYLRLAGQGLANHRPLAAVDLWSASITDFLLPAPTHPLWGRWVASHVDRPLWVEQYVYLGVVPLLLLAAALWPRGWKLRLPRRDVWWIAGALLGSLILAMGTTLHWLGRPVLVSYPAFLAERSSLLAHGYIPLPNYLLYKYLPFYDGMRAWVRYGVYVSLFGAVLAGVGYARIRARIVRPGLAGVALAATILLIAIDYRVVIPMTPARPRPIDTWLRDAPAAGAVAQFPISESTEPVYVLGSLTHRKPLLGMFYGAYLPRDFVAILPDLERFPDEASLRVLRQRQVAYVVVDAVQYPRWTADQIRCPSGGLTLQGKVGQYLIYRLQPATAASSGAR